MSTLDKRKKKKFKERDLGWAKWFGIILAILTAGIIIAEFVQMASIAG